MKRLSQSGDNKRKKQSILFYWDFFPFQDKAADFSTANSVGVRNNIYAILLLGTYEVLMEHNLTVATLR